jgi:hypothetical protein
MLNYRCILLAAAGAQMLLPLPALAAKLEDTSKIIAAQLHKQGVTCTMARDAMRKVAQSTPNVSVWILRCAEATYRVRLIPRRQALITPIAAGTENVAGAASTETHPTANTRELAALEASDPERAPVASVDRFSDTAGTLLRRSADKRLPGPNEPIDFDAQPLNTLGLSPSGEPVLYYHLDVQSTTPAPVYILYRDGEDKPVAGQLHVIDTLPGEKGYNDFRDVWKVEVPKSYVANTITDAAALAKSGYRIERTPKLINMPVMPDESHASVRFKGGQSQLQSAWYKGEIAKYLLFDEAPLSVSGGEVPVSPIYDGFTINPGEPNGGTTFRMEPNSMQTHNIVASVPGDKDYSPLWLRIVYDSAAWNKVHDLETAQNAKVIPAETLLINCPIVRIEH